MNKIVCEYFALCTNDTEGGFTEHPALGLVPTCARRAGRFELERVFPAGQEARP